MPIALSTPRCEASPIRRGCAVPWPSQTRTSGTSAGRRLEQQRHLAEGEQAGGVREDREPDGDRHVDPGPCRHLEHDDGGRVGSGVVGQVEPRGRQDRRVIVGDGDQRAGFSAGPAPRRRSRAGRSTVWAGASGGSSLAPGPISGAYHATSRRARLALAGWRWRCAFCLIGAQSGPCARSGIGSSKLGWRACVPTPTAGICRTFRTQCCGPGTWPP
jgi:hypothetical protein